MLKRFFVGCRKRLGLCILIMLLLPGLTGCFIQPDRTIDPLAVDADNQGVVTTLSPTPEPTPAPTPTASPLATASGFTGQANSSWESWGSGTSAPSATSATGSSTATGSSWQTSTEDYNAGYPVLRVGSSGNDVYDMQERLKELGYYTGTLDGKFASGTQDAVISFQQNNGLTADGIAGRATQDKLYSATAKAKTVSVSSGSSSGSSSSGSGSSSSSSSGSNSSGILKNGSTGTEVRKLQVRLAELGYYSGGADGIFGTSTESAVKAFQKNNSLSADGQAGPATLAKVNSSDAKKAVSPVQTADPNAVRALRQGMEGNDVYSMQKRLIELGYLNGVPDALFGAETAAAVLAFQKNNGLTADGVAGVSTLNKLNSSSAKQAGVTATQAPSSGYVTLQQGDSGQYVYDIQERLYDLGYYEGRIDGRYGTGTAQAIRSFQSAHGLTVDGVAGTETQRKLFASSAQINPSILSTPLPATPTPVPASSYTVLQSGSTGADVGRLQQYLFELGYYLGRIDQQYGPKLAEAVRLFQQCNGLTADGIAGQTTQQFLYSGQAVRLPASMATAAPDLTLTLREGDSGEAVTQMQFQLYLLGYMEESYVDSNFGSTTTDAVLRFQEMNSLDMDGVAGPGTLKQLYDINALYYIPQSDR